MSRGNASNIVRSSARLPAGLALCALLGACVAGSHNERPQLAAPTSVSELYSNANLEMMLAVASSAAACAGEECEQRVKFDERVSRTGARLALQAYQSYPGLAERVPSFEFSVMDKSEPGTGSTALGRIVVLRPVSELAPADEALSFVIAREMGHVVGQHHEENTAFSLITSALVTVFAPVAGVLKVLSAMYSGATTITASAAVTAGSFASSRALIESYRPKQREEADDIAVALLASVGYQPKSVPAGFAIQARTPVTRWGRELRASIERLNERISEPLVLQDSQTSASVASP